VIRGRAEKPVYLYIHDGAIEIRSAETVWGSGVYDTQDLIRRELDDPETQVLCIGQAGENLVRFACVMTGRKNAAGRTGMGAVMGSKNLKAVACRGTTSIGIKFPQEALEYNKEIIDQVISTKVSQIMQRWGTGFIYGVTNTTGLVRCRNFQYNQIPNSEDIECENLDKYSIGLDGCFGCQVHCRHRYIIKERPYAGTYAQGPEYTSQGAFGAEVGCRRLAARPLLRRTDQAGPAGRPGQIHRPGKIQGHDRPILPSARMGCERRAHPGTARAAPDRRTSHRCLKRPRAGPNPEL
jgi:aldehyde:ferredoxin oxidoreductase